MCAYFNYILKQLPFVTTLYLDVFKVSKAQFRLAMTLWRRTIPNNLLNWVQKHVWLVNNFRQFWFWWRICNKNFIDVKITTRRECIMKFVSINKTYVTLAKIYVRYYNKLLLRNFVSLLSRTVYIALYVIDKYWR